MTTNTWSRRGMPLGTGPCSAFAMHAPISAAIHDASTNFFIDLSAPDCRFLLVRIVGKDCDIAVSAGMAADNSCASHLTFLHRLSFVLCLFGNDTGRSLFLLRRPAFR